MSYSHGINDRVRQWHRYPKYKDLGDRGFSQIPVHWYAMKVKYLCRIDTCGAWGSDPDDTILPVPVATTADLDMQGTFYLEGMSLRVLSVQEKQKARCNLNDIIVVKSSGSATNIVSGKCGIVRDNHKEFYFGNFLMRLCPFQNVIHPHFLWRFLSSSIVRSEIELMVATTTYPNLKVDEYAGMTVPVPPTSEQVRIVAFLDREMAKFDDLIAKKERLIELLLEKRTALISHTVTKGVDSTVPMKDSGDKWIGTVPAHWTQKKVKYLFRFAKRQNYPDLTVLSVYRDYGVIEKTTRDDNHNRTPEDLTTYQLVNVGDLVINKMKAWQGSLGISSLHGITSPDYVVYKCTNDEHLPYLHHRLRIPSMAATFHCISNGIRPDQWRLEPEKFEQLWLFLPPVEEQKRICDCLDKQIAAIDILRAKVREGIDKLREYRTALISAAVTGKIDVREEVA